MQFYIANKQILDILIGSDHGQACANFQANMLSPLMTVQQERLKWLLVRAPPMQIIQTLSRNHRRTHRCGCIIRTVSQEPNQHVQVGPFQLNSFPRTGTNNICTADKPQLCRPVWLMVVDILLNSFRIGLVCRNI